MACSGVATTDLHMYRQHTPVTTSMWPWGPAGSLACALFFKHFYALKFIFSPPHKTHLPSLPGVVYPWRSACLGRGGGLVKEKGRERGSRVCEGGGGGERARAHSAPPPSLHPWTCSLRRGRRKASPVVRTLLGGRAKCPPPLDTLKRERRRGDMEGGQH